MKFFECDGERTYFADVGHGRAVLLLHGLSNSGRAWGLQTAFLYSSGFRVIVPDLLGHGASSLVRSPLSMNDLALRIADLLRSLSLSEVDVVGISLGGMIAMELALCAPQLVEKLVVCNTFASFCSEERLGLVDEWLMQLSTIAGCVNRFENTWKQLVSDDFAKSCDGISTFLAWHAQAAMASATSHAAICEGMKCYDLRENLSSIKSQTLVIQGELDLMSPTSEGDFIVQAIPNAEIVQISGSRHLSNVDSATKFNSTLIDFLNREHLGQGVMNR